MFWFCSSFFNLFTDITEGDLNHIGKAIAAGILTQINILANINILVSTSFETNMKQWRTIFVPFFISRCELLCFTQDLDNSQESLFHFLGVILFPFFSFMFWSFLFLFQVFVCMASQSYLCLALKRLKRKWIRWILQKEEESELECCLCQILFVNKWNLLMFVIFFCSLALSVKSYEWYCSKRCVGVNCGVGLKGFEKQQ